MRYRADIQALRGVAVLLVIFYHLNFKVLGAGFLGVDIFFVISGFLMAVLYKSNQKLNFYKRRIYRLLPSYFVVLIVTFIFSIFLVKPSEFENVIGNAYSSSFVMLNVSSVFINSYFQNTYFNPFLHFWSLAVEFQFYLLVPLLLLKRYKLLWLILCFTFSLTLCFYMVSLQPTFSFFLTPFRIWEFIIGMITGLYFTSQGNVKYDNFRYFGSMALCFLLSLTLLGFDGNAKNLLFGHPGLGALLTCILTGIVLTFGLPNYFIKSIVGRFLILSGKYSYSLYLVHYPVILLYGYSAFYSGGVGHHSFLDILYISMFIVFFSYLLYRFVEVSKNITFKYIAILIFISLTTVIVTDLHKHKIWGAIYNTQEYNIYNSMNDRSDFRCGKFYGYLNRGVDTCKLNDVNSNEAVLLVGNSHADSIKSQFLALANKYNVNLHFYVKNNPLMLGGPSVQELIEESKRLKINNIYFHYSPGVLDLGTLTELEYLTNRNSIKVHFLLPIPTYDTNIPSEILNDYQNGLNTPRQYNSLFFEEDPLNELKVSFPRFQVQDPFLYFCLEKCKVSSNNFEPYYFDNGHLTLTGSKILSPLFEDYFITNFNGVKLENSKKN